MPDTCPVCGLPRERDHFDCAVSVKHILWMTQNECALLNTALTKAEGTSKMQEGFFHVAMDRALQAEAKIEHLHEVLEELSKNLIAKETT